MTQRVNKQMLAKFMGWTWDSQWAYDAKGERYQRRHVDDFWMIPEYEERVDLLLVKLASMYQVEMKSDIDGNWVITANGVGAWGTLFDAICEIVEKSPTQE